MKISVVGTGYVGLVTGVALSHIGHKVTCVDIDQNKVEKMNKGISPIYEPGLEELMVKNINEGRLFFSANHREGFKDSKVIYIAVGTPEKADGSANLTFIEQVAKDIAVNIEENVIVVTKSTVPVGTNHYIKDIIEQHLIKNVKVEIVSNPEFLREGSSVYDTFNGDRIVVGADNTEAAQVIKEINEPFGIPVYVTDVQSAEMIKYASNAFLATKISFINEIGNICEKLGADIESVAYGMGLDKRIGSMFLNAGIGYGGSCFPKDTKALTQIASNIDHQFELLESVIKVNNNQQSLLIEKAKDRVGNLRGKKVALLGLSFKPNTDDMREAASIVISKRLLEEEAEVIAFDPIAVSNAKRIIGEGIQYTESLEEALQDSDFALIVTEWNQIKEINLQTYVDKMSTPLIFDGRNCYDLNEVEKYNLEYHSMGRRSVVAKPAVAVQ
ncbi:UDP-glucose dehydrogenase family protein [Fictibacillus fluitans]|uniref:UDP-glucose 6-dehydrogenase n=1 Tax=Fictibacillus fluitans TaxID=3058422 RepID=A0ABT8HT99_9BACL|nr:UDP-glucose/GDP-mannose dehydrogenase family protein [Fictibacillus sp. NE201]MDN4523954.1 UDP-glucose/GDP-mannose dehydrogenase family protein [Fictibacillus sp. NE201]